MSQHNHHTTPASGGGCCGGGGGGGDHGGDGGMDHDMDHMMSMSFHFGVKETILFDWWKTTTINELIVACFIVGVLAALYEGLKYTREVLLRNRLANQSVVGSSSALHGSPSEPTFREALCSGSHLLQTFMHVIQFTMAYLLMLVFMTYNVSLCAAVVVGSGIGYYLYGWRSRSLENCSDHCH